MSKDYRVYLAHILESADKIAKYINAGEKAFFTETQIQDAVIRNFEIIGEAVKRVPDEFKSKHTDIPWRLMSGFRDVLIHDYDGVNLIRVWHIADSDLPIVRNKISALLPSLDTLEKEIAGEYDVS